MQQLSRLDLAFYRNIPTQMHETCIVSSAFVRYFCMRGDLVVVISEEINKMYL